jgi:cytidylate kinase
MMSIVICGMAATGKTTVASIISRKLSLPLIGGGDILKEMAQERGYSPSGDNWWDTEEGVKFLMERQKNPEFDKEADRKLVEKIKKGNIVVTSWTAPWITGAGFKVWLSASEETRAKRMSLRDKTNIKESSEMIRIRDRENYSLYKEMYNINLGKDKTPFNLIINTDNKTPEAVADIIIEKVMNFKKDNVD